MRAGAADPPLTQEQVNHIAQLVAPYIGKISITDQELVEAGIRNPGDPPLADWQRTAIAGLAAPYLNRRLGAERRR
jgi:hypothetical protein